MSTAAVDLATIRNQTLAEVAEESGSLLLEGEALRQHWDAPEEEPEVLLNTQGHGLFYRGAVNVLAGDSGTGKSLLAFEAVRQEIAFGRNALLLDFEQNPSRNLQRARDLGLPWETVRDRLKVLDYRGFVSADLWEEVLKLSLGVVIVDSFTAAYGALSKVTDSNSGDLIERFMNRRPRVLSRRTGAAVIVIDHKPKASTQSRGSIGSERKLSGVQGAVYTAEAILTPAPEALGQIRLVLDKDNAGAIKKRLSADREKYSMTQEAAFVEVDSRPFTGNDAPTVIRIQPPRSLGERKAEKFDEVAEVLTGALSSNGGTITSRKAVEDALKAAGAGLKHETVLELLEHGTARGLWSVERIGEHKTAPLRVTLVP